MVVCLQNIVFNLKLSYILPIGIFNLYTRFYHQCKFTGGEAMAKITNFIKIKTVHDLILYLEDPKRDKTFFYHYTTINRFNQILKNKVFVFSCFEAMNDGHEAGKLEADFSRNAFVGSFSRADNEVMAMWGMYAIPWEMGVRIGIPKALFRKWIKETRSGFEVENEIIKQDNPVEITLKKINAVCYYDKLNHKLDWSNRRLYLSRLNDLKEPDTKPALNGYIKHKTWSYEEEIRVLIKTETEKTMSKIAIPIPDYVLSDLNVVLGPCFEASEPLENSPRYILSEFTGKITPKKVCYACVHYFKYAPDGKKID